MPGPTTRRAIRQLLLDMSRTSATTSGGGVFYGQVTPASADAAPVHYISTLNATTLTVTWTSATSGGSGNLSYRYDVELEVQR